MVLGACGGESGSEALCADSVRYEGQLLVGTSRDLERDLPARAGEVEVLDGCSGRRRSLQTRRGVPPSVAVFPSRPLEPMPGRADMYVANDSVAGPRGHPLHDAFFGRADVPDLTSGRDCTDFRRRSTIGGVRSDTAVVLGDGAVIGVEARTVIEGVLVDGVPRLPSGSSVTVRAVRCEGRQRPVARHIIVAGA
jgi:hypothetical protein